MEILSYIGMLIGLNIIDDTIIMVNSEAPLKLYVVVSESVIYFGNHKVFCLPQISPSTLR